MITTAKQLLAELRRQGITNISVLEAIEKVPRDIFIPVEHYELAWENQALHIGEGQYIGQPLLIALMLEYLKIEQKHLVLEVGTGSGYLSLVLSYLSRRVYSMERSKNLLGKAVERFMLLERNNITAMHRDGKQGWPGRLRFQRIIVNAVGEKIPEMLFAQLEEGGLMLMPLWGKDGKQYLNLITKKDDKPEYEELDIVRFSGLLDGED